MISVNQRARRLFDALCARCGGAARRRYARPNRRDAGRCRSARGGIAAGLRIAEICMGGLGEVSPARATPRRRAGPGRSSVPARQPVIACLASQYAGWSLSHGEKPGGVFRARLGSGARAGAARRRCLPNSTTPTRRRRACWCWRAAGRRRPADRQKVAHDCGVAPDAARRSSMRRRRASRAACRSSRACSRWRCTRRMSCSFPLRAIVDGMGTAPLPPPHPDFVTAMGRTNDAIIFAGRVHLFVTGPAAEARALADALPASGSRDYGKPVRRNLPRAARAISTRSIRCCSAPPKRS